VVHLGHFLGFLSLEDGSIQLVQLHEGDLDALHQPPAPGQRARDGGQVPCDWALVSVVQEQLLHGLEVLSIALHQADVLVLQLVLYDGSLQQPLEAVQQLEPPIHIAAVVERQTDYRAQPPLQLLDRAPEVVEVVVEGLGAHVHDVVGHCLELGHGVVEVLVNLLDAGRKGLALRAPHLDLGQLGELHDGLRQVQDVVAALQEGVQAHEQRVVLDLPGVRGALRVGGGFVVEVGGFEGPAHGEGGLQHGHGEVGLLRLDHGEYLLARDVLSGLLDEGVADLAHEHHQTGGDVVVLGVLPDQQYDVQHGLEQLHGLGEVVFAVEGLEPVLQGAEVLGVVVGLGAGSEHLSAQAGEGGAVGGLGLVQSTQHASDTGALQLLEYAVEVGGLVAPEVDLHIGRGVHALLQLRLRVLLQH